MLKNNDGGKMQEFNKFRVITAGFILMFVFVVAAMYTNTKDITEQKVKEAGGTVKQNVNPYDFNKKKFKNNEQMNLTDENEVSQLEKRITYLENSIANIKTEMASNKRSNLNCQIRGILDNDEVVPFSPRDAIDEANMNNREIVITCRVK